MADGVDPAEVAEYGAMLKNGGTMPSVESGCATVAQPIAKRKKNPQTAGRFADMNAFVDVTMAGLTRVEVNTWFTMFRYVDAKRGTVTVSVRTLAGRVGANVRHVHNAISSLIEKGLLERIKTGGLNRGSSVYRVKPTVTP